MHTIIVEAALSTIMQPTSGGPLFQEFLMLIRSLHSAHSCGFCGLAYAHVFICVHYHTNPTLRNFSVHLFYLRKDRKTLKRPSPARIFPSLPCKDKIRAQICMFQMTKDPLLFLEARGERRGRKMLVWFGHCLKTEHDSPSDRAACSHVRQRRAKNRPPSPPSSPPFSAPTGRNVSDCLRVPQTHYLFTSFIWHKIMTSCCLFLPK